jgi:uncharacterized protein involved in outer membrane biogenesis
MKVLKIVGGVLAALIAVVVVVLLTVDVSQYKGVIQQQAKAATGRDVTIGDIKLSLSLTPAIVLTDVTVANAPWGSRPQMLTLKSAEASTQLIPLLFGTVNISGLKLVEPDVILETNAQGRGNWEFDTAQPAAGAGAGQTTPLNVSGVTVEGLKLAYRDGKTKATANLAAKSGEVDMDGALNDMVIPSATVTGVTGAYAAGATGAQGSATELTFTAVGPISDFNLTSLKASDVKGSYKDGPSAYEGAVGNLTLTGAARNVADRAATTDLVAALKALNVTQITLENASASMKGGDGATTATIAKIDAQSRGPIGKLGITNLVVSNGKLVRTGGAAIDAEITTLSLDSGGKLELNAKVGGGDVKASGTLAPIATLAAMDKDFPAKIIFEGMGLKGTTDVTVNVSGDRPRAQGAVTIPELNLATFIKPSPAGDKLFSDEPLPWDSLAATDANVRISIGKLTLPSGLVLANVVLPVELNRGHLVASNVSFNVAGGTVTSNLQMNARDKTFGLASQAKGLTAEAIAREMKKGDAITQGPLDVNLSVRGAGNSAHDIAASLGGSFILGMGESRIRSGTLNIVGADILMQVLGVINPLNSNDPYTAARCGVVNLQIANGVGTTNNGIALVTDKMQLTSSGTVNFGTERVDLSVRPRATGGAGVGLGMLAQAIRVQGPLASPSIGVDKAGAAKTLGTLGAALATGGLSALAQGAKDRVEATGDPCQTARTWHLKK